MSEETVSPVAPPFPTLEELIGERERLANILNVEVPQIRDQFNRVCGAIEALQSQNGHVSEVPGPNRATRRAK